jgi:hypothetical protein
VAVAGIVGTFGGVPIAVLSAAGRGVMTEPTEVGAQVIDGEGDVWQRIVAARPWVCVSQGAVSGLTSWELEIGFNPIRPVVG